MTAKSVSTPHHLNFKCSSVQHMSQNHCDCTCLLFHVHFYFILAYMRHWKWKRAWNTCAVKAHVEWERMRNKQPYGMQNRFEIWHCNAHAVGIKMHMAPTVLNHIPCGRDTHVELKRAFNGRHVEYGCVGSTCVVEAWDTRVFACELEGSIELDTGCGWLGKRKSMTTRLERIHMRSYNASGTQSSSAWKGMHAECACNAKHWNSDIYVRLFAVIR